MKLIKAWAQRDSRGILYLYRKYKDPKTGKTKIKVNRSVHKDPRRKK